MFFDDRKFLCRGLITVILIGVIVRMMLGYYLEYNNDISAMTTTIANIDSGNGLYSVAGYYYPPVWGYMLATFGEIIEHLGVDSLGDYFTEILFMEEIDEEAIVITPVFSFVYTMYLMISDFLVSAAIYWIIYHFTEDRVKAKIGFTMFFLGIHVFIISAVGGMFDTFSALFTLICIILLLRGMDFSAGIMFALGVLLKLFPAFFIFILIAYIIKKYPDCWKIRLSKAIIGAALVTLIIMLPQIIEGTVMNSLSFITGRAGGSSGTESLSFWEKYHDLIHYVLMMVLEIVVAVVFFKRKTDDVDRTFVLFTIVSALIIFLNPGSPQYGILLTPFLIIGTVIYCPKMIWAYIVFMIGSIVGHMMHFQSDFIAITMFNHAMPFDTFVSFYDFYHSNDHFYYELLFDLGYNIESIGVLLGVWVILPLLGIEVIEIVKKHLPKKEEGSQ